MMHQEKLSLNNQDITESKQSSGSQNDHTGVINESSSNTYLKALPYLCNSNNDAFVGKLRLESNKIVEWQIKKDIELKELEKNLNKLEELIEKQRKNLFQLQMQCENISQEYANGVKQKEGLEEKAKNTLNICNILREHYQKLNFTFRSFVSIKDEISNKNKTIKVNYAHLKKKFEALYSRRCDEIFTYKKKYNHQNELHMIKRKEYKQLITSLEEKYKYYENEIIKMKDINNKLEADLVSNNNNVQEFTETKNRATAELTEKVIHLEGNLSEAMNMKNIAAKEVDALKNNVFEYEKLQIAYTKSQDKRNELSNNLTEVQKKVEELTVTLKENQETNNKILNENCQLSDKIEEICASVEQYKNLLQEESQDKAKLQAGLIEANINIQQIMKDIEELLNSSETEALKLNQVISDLNKEIEEVSITHGEYKQQKHDLQHLMEQRMNEVTELNVKIGTLKEVVTRNVEKSTVLREDLENIKNEKSEMDKTLCKRREEMELVSNENDLLKSEIDEIQKKQEELEKALMNKQQITKQEILNREIECSVAIKECMSSMEEYKLSYGEKLTHYDKERNELTEKICHLEKDNKQFNFENKIAKEKVLIQENFIKSMETKLQNMESEIFKLKLDIENEKRKGFEASVKKATKKKVENTKIVPRSENQIRYQLYEHTKDVDDYSLSPEQVQHEDADQFLNSHKRLSNYLTSTPKRVCFDDWSDVTDDSCMDLNLFHVENTKIVPRTENQIRSQLYEHVKHVDDSSLSPEQVQNEVTSSTNVSRFNKKPTRNAKVLKNNNTSSEKNIFSSFLK